MPHMLAQEDPQAFAGLLAEFGASQPFTFLEAGDTPAELASRFLEARGVDVEDVAGEDESFDFAALHDPLQQELQQIQRAELGQRLRQFRTALAGGEGQGAGLTEAALSDPFGFIFDPESVPGLRFEGPKAAFPADQLIFEENVAFVEREIGMITEEFGGSPTESGGPSEGGTSIPDGTGTGGGGGGTGGGGGGGGGAVVPTEGIPFSDEAGAGGLGGGLGLLAVAAVGVFLLAR